MACGSSLALAMCRLARIRIPRKMRKDAKATAQAIGDEPVTLMVIELDVTPTVDQTRRSK
jgi:hypothetical protein